MQEEPTAAGEAGPSNAGDGDRPGQSRPKQQERTKSHVGDMLAAMAAHQQLERYACVLTALRDCLQMVAGYSTCACAGYVHSTSSPAWISCIILPGLSDDMTQVWE